MVMYLHFIWWRTCELFCRMFGHDWGCGGMIMSCYRCGAYINLENPWSMLL